MSTRQPVAAAAAVVAAALDAAGPAPSTLPSEPWAAVVQAILAVDASETGAQQTSAVLAEHVTGPDDMHRLRPAQLAAFLRHLPGAIRKGRALSEAARHWTRLSEAGVSPAALARLPGLDRVAAAAVLDALCREPVPILDRQALRCLTRLGWGRSSAEIELTLRQAFPPERWAERSRQLSRLARTHCRPQRPLCQTCPCASDCPRFGVQAARGAANPITP